MQRWHVTAGLAVLAVAGAVLAPRLSALINPVEAPAPPPVPSVAPPAPVEPGVAAVRVDPVPIPPEPATPSGHLVVEAGLDRTAVLQGRREERFLTITVTAPDNMGHTYRRPVDLSVVMDVSGSMSRRGKIDYAKRAAKVLAAAMRDGDTYSLVTFSDDARSVIPATGITHVGAVHSAIDRIQEGGSTNLYAGLTQGGAEIRRTLDGENVGRVIVLSDGKANVGRTDTHSLAQLVGGLSGEGITVSTVGLGLDFDEDRMANLADVGGGSYDFVGDPSQLQAVFADELERTASVVARRTTLDIELPAGVEGIEVLGWNTRRTDAGWTLSLGDIHAGETRKIVARVRVTGDAAGTIDVADVAADYLDLVDGRQAESTASAAANVTTDSRLVARSWDKRKAAAASQAWGNHQLQLSARAYERGDVSAAQDLATESAKILRRASIDFEDADLAAEAAQVDELNSAYQAASPASGAGKRNIKQAKEWYLDRTR